MTINEQLKQLQQEVIRLKAKLEDLSENVESKTSPPYSKTGTGRHNTQNTPVDPFSGLGGTKGGHLAWNDSELVNPPLNAQPSEPTKGYHKHGHSRYSGGAFDIHTIEFVEYDTDENNNIIDPEGNILNKHCQQFWSSLPNITEEEKDLEEGGSELIPKIGGISSSLVFDKSDSQWKFFAVYAEEEETA